MIVCIGEHYGTRKVVVYYRRNGQEVRHNRWLCQCECGRLDWIYEKNLTSNCRGCAPKSLYRKGHEGVGDTYRSTPAPFPIRPVPGSEERILDLQRRAAQRVALNHPEDLNLRTLKVD